jgi:hypothetical protein
MKLADIKVGEYYVYGTRGRRGSFQRVRALEVGRHVVRPGGDFVPAVRVCFVVPTGECDPTASSKPWVVIRQIIMTWAEYEAQRAESGQSRERQYDQAMVARVRKVVDRLAELGAPTGTLIAQITDSRTHTGFVEVRVEFLEGIVRELAR